MKLLNQKRNTLFKYFFVAMFFISLFFKISVCLAMPVEDIPAFGQRVESAIVQGEQAVSLGAIDISTGDVAAATDADISPSMLSTAADLDEMMTLQTVTAVKQIAAISIAMVAAMEGIVEVIRIAAAAGGGSGDIGDTASLETFTDLTGSQDRLSAGLKNYQMNDSTDVGNRATQYDTNQTGTKNVTSYSNLSYVSAVGGNPIHSEAHATAAQNFVTNASGAGVGMSNPIKSNHPTPEIVEHRAMFNQLASQKSIAAHSLSTTISNGAPQKPTATDREGKPVQSSTTSSMSEAINALTFKQCTSNLSKTDWIAAFQLMICIPLNMPRAAVAGVYAALPLLRDAPSLISGLLSAVTTGLQLGFLDPMGEQALSSMIGSDANTSKK